MELVLVAFIFLLANHATVAPKLVVYAPGQSEQAQPVSKSDFIIFHVAGSIAGDAPRKLYDGVLEQKLQADIIKAKDYALTPYLYPPQSLFFFEPLAHLPLYTSYLFWHAINAVCSLFLLILLWRAGVCTALGSLLAATLLLVSSSPWIGSMADGQPTIIMTLGLLGGWLFAREGRFAWAWLAIILTAFKPPLIAGPALFLLFLYGRNSWLSLLASLFAIAAACAVAFGIDVWPAWLNAVAAAPSLLRAEFGVMQMCNLRTLLLGFTHGRFVQAIDVFNLALLVGSLIAAVMLAIAARRKSAAVKELGFGLFAALACVLSPYLYSNSLFLLVIPVAYALKGARVYALAAVILVLGTLGVAAVQLPGEMNALLWVPAQCALIIWLACRLRHEWNANAGSGAPFTVS